MKAIQRRAGASGRTHDRVTAPDPAAGETVGKENKRAAGRGNSKPSRIPRPVSRARTEPLRPQNSVSQPSLDPPLTPGHCSQATSRVKPVPDFLKLHKTFRNKMTKRKEKKVATEFKTFDLTPSSGKRRERLSARPEGPGKEESEVETAGPCFSPLSSSLEETIGPLQQEPPKALPLSPRQQIRLSVYSKRNRALQRVLQSSAVVRSGAAPERGAGEFSQLLQRLVQSTVTSLRTISRRTGAGEAGLEGVKLKLESQLEAVEEEAPVSQTACLTHTSPTFTRPHHHPPLPPDHAPSSLRPDHAPPLPVYCQEEELCAISWSKDGCSGGGRPSCPVARLLEQCYFLPVASVVARNSRNRL